MKVLAIYSLIVTILLEYGLVKSGLKCEEFKNAKVFIWSSIVYAPIVAFLIKYVFGI